ncbi:MAG TPA: FG-GAP-like repeat-containing protein, partial [Planctomycetota bacterium]|nr:FG-GAP-like repeat-containing protein [Planctomycetota bacterium]
IAIDFDGDGDQDLVVWGGTSPTLLLRNDGDHFVDSTFGHIPSPDIAPAQLVSKGDVDGDGDDDLLVGRFNQSNLLRNDHGVFTRVANVAPLGVLVDVDDDGRADVFTGESVLYDLFANLRAPRLALPGTDWLMQVRTWRQGSVPYLALVAVGTRWLAWPVAIPGLGTFYVDMATADVFPVALTAGQGERVLQIPNTPLVLGVNLVAQAAIFDTQSVVLTGPVFDAVR